MYGAFDPFSEIADICEKYGLWMHVDVRPLYILSIFFNRIKTSDVFCHLDAAGSDCQ